MGKGTDERSGITGRRASFNNAARRTLFSPSFWYVAAAAFAGIGGAIAARPDGGLTGWLVGATIALGAAGILTWRRNALREGVEHQLRDAIDAVADGFLLFDPEDRLIVANRQALELYAPIADLLVPGTPYVDIILTAVYERGIFGGDETSALDAIFERRLNDHREASGRASIYRTSNGRWIRIREHRTPGGSVVGLRTDVTELKEREHAIAESEARLRTLYNNTPVMMHTIGGDGRIISVSEHWLHKMGYRREEVLGRRSVEFFTDECRREVEADGGLKSLNGRGPVVDDPRSFRKKDGGRMDALVSTFIERDAKDRFVQSIAVLTDVTELRDREAELTELSEELAEKNRMLDAALKHMSHGLAMFDADLRMVMCNERYGQLFDRPAKLRTPGASLPGMIRYDGDVMGWSDEETEARIEERAGLAAQREDGIIMVDTLGGRTMKIFHSPLSNGGSLAIYEDVTEIEAHERALREAKEAAELANRTKSEFLANMSHELRTPLNAVIGFSEIIRSELFGSMGVEKYRDYARDIHESGSHLLSLINDILDVSKIEAGKIELDEGDVALEHVAAASLRLVQARAADAGLDVELELNHGDARLHADERMIKQMLLNLLSNAVKFTTDGGRVTLYSRLDPDGAFVLGVRDTGIGIEAADIPKVLAPFGQVASALTRRHTGTGLGLPLVKSFVEIHGGELRLDSEPGRGTDAAVRFPAERTVLPALEAATAGG